LRAGVGAWIELLYRQSGLHRVLKCFASAVRRHC
jgi:hypothetical protein